MEYSANSNIVETLIEKSVGEIANDSKLSKKIVLKHLNSGSLKYSYYKNSRYGISDYVYKKWLSDIPDLEVIQLSSIFSSSENKDNNNINLIENVTVADSLESFCIINDFDVDSSLTFADMFCGCGGLSLGFVQAGFKPIDNIDIFEDALKTYKKNISDKFQTNVSEIQTSDITQLETKSKVINNLKSNKVKVICGGFPCQGFSISGTGVATDPRNTLYLDMLEIVNETKPEFIVMENVVGILSMLDGKVVNKIISDYKQIGYDVSYKVLNAVNYGVAQNRKRVIFVGNRINSNNPFPESIITNPANFVTVKQCISKYLNIENKEINHIFSKHSENMKKRLSIVPIGGHLYPHYSDSWRKTDPDKPSCTIKENHGATNIHYEYDRTMSPRELAALQSFPDDFIFEGSKTTILKQIGNAVPPLMAKAIALALKTKLKNNY